MTPSTLRLKQLAEAATPGSWQYLEFDPHSIPEACHGVLCTEDRYIGCDVGKKDGAFISAANPEAVLGLIARIEKLEAALEHIAKIDTCSTQPDLVWLSDWRNETKRFANEALRGES